MKITLEKSDKDYLYIAMILLLVSLSIFYQVKTAKTHNLDIYVREELNKKQKVDIGTLELSVLALDTKTKELMLEADSLQASEEKYKLNYYAANKKYKDALATYNNASDDDKWRTLTKIINE